MTGRNVARVLTGLVLVGASVLCAFTADPPERAVWLCGVDQPRCAAMSGADR